MKLFKQNRYEQEIERLENKVHNCESRIDSLAKDINVDRNNFKDAFNWIDKIRDRLLEEISDVQSVPIDTTKEVTEEDKLSDNEWITLVAYADNPKYIADYYLRIVSYTDENLIANSKYFNLESLINIINTII